MKPVELLPGMVVYWAPILAMIWALKQGKEEGKGR